MATLLPISSVDKNIPEKLQWWIPQEDKILLEGVRKFGNNWKTITHLLENRTTQQCIARFKLIEKKRTIDASDQEKKALNEIIAENQDANWKKIKDLYNEKYSGKNFRSLKDITAMGLQIFQKQLSTQGITSSSPSSPSSISLDRANEKRKNEQSEEPLSKRLRSGSSDQLSPSLHPPSDSLSPYFARDKIALSKPSIKKTVGEVKVSDSSDDDNSVRIKGEWTPEEDKKLLKGVDKFGKQWAKIEEFMKYSRNSMQCLRRFQRIDPNFTAGAFSVKEKKALAKVIRDNPNVNPNARKRWGKITREFNKKFPNQAPRSQSAISEQCRLMNRSQRRSCESVPSYKEKKEQDGLKKLIFNFHPISEAIDQPASGSSLQDTNPSQNPQSVLPDLPPLTIPSFPPHLGYLPASSSMSLFLGLSPFTSEPSSASPELPSILGMPPPSFVDSDLHTYFSSEPAFAIQSPNWGEDSQGF